MVPDEIGFLAFVVGVFTLFGGVLGFASWEETRDRRKREKERRQICVDVKDSRRITHDYRASASAAVSTD